MELAAHAALQCRVNHLVLLNAVLPLEGGRHDHRRPVIVVTGKIGHGDIRVGERFLDQVLDFRCRHAHQFAPIPSWPVPAMTMREGSSASTIQFVTGTSSDAM